MAYGGDAAISTPQVNPAVYYAAPDRSSLLRAALGDHSGFQTTEYAYAFRVEPDGRTVNEWRSPGLWKISGYTSDEVDRLGWQTLVHPDDREVLLSRNQNLIAGRPVTGEYRIVTRDGDTRWIRDFAQPIWDEDEQRVIRFVGGALDVTEQRIAQLTLMAQTRVLELAAAAAPLDDVLLAIVEMIDMHCPGAISSIQVSEADGKHLRTGASLKLPRAFLDRVPLIPIGLHEGSCGHSAHLRKPVLSVEIATDPIWAKYADLAREFELAACWSIPVFGAGEDLLGTFAMYYREPHVPREYERKLLENVVPLAGIALEMHRVDAARRIAETRFQTLVEHIPAITFLSDPTNIVRLHYISPQVQEIIGVEPDVATTGNREQLLTMIHTDDRARVADAMRASNETQTPLHTQFRFQRSEGMTQWLQCDARLVRNTAGEAIHWQGMLVDITERIESERRVAQSERRYRSLFDYNPNGVLSLDLQGRFIEVNTAVQKISGYEPDELIGRTFMSVLVAGELENVWAHLVDAMNGTSGRFETAIFRKSGQRVGLSVSVSPTVVDGRVVGVSAIAEDITDRKRLEAQLLHQAFFDALTDLPNRVRIIDRLAQMITVARRRNRRIALLFLDLDNFKVINDSLGHDLGDKLLIALARRLESNVGADTFVGRFGGNKFAVILDDDARARQDTVQVAEQILRDLKRPVMIQGHELITTASIGIVEDVQWVQDPHEAIRQADIALYQAKRRSSEMRYVTFQPSMNQRVAERLQIEYDLRRAIAGQQLVVYYQPIVDVVTGKATRVEALVRWNHPKKGLLSPGQFLSIAEETGQISQIDQWVMGEACRTVHRWNTSRPEASPLHLSVNLSVRDLRRPEFSEHVRQILEQSGLAPGHLRLEITESEMMDDVETAAKVVHALRELGVGLAIDDFGTGYSSLAYLRRLPLDALKIDRSFVRGFGIDSDDEAVARAIISLAQALGLEVTAEGVETEAQFERARELGCHQVQGYYVTRPAPFDQILDTLQ